MAYDTPIDRTETSFGLGDIPNGDEFQFNFDQVPERDAPKPEVKGASDMGGYSNNGTTAFGFQDTHHNDDGSTSYQTYSVTKKADGSGFATASYVTKDKDGNVIYSEKNWQKTNSDGTSVTKVTITDAEGNSTTYYVDQDGKPCDENGNPLEKPEEDGMWIPFEDMDDGPWAFPQDTFQDATDYMMTEDAFKLTEMADVAFFDMM